VRFWKNAEQTGSDRNKRKEIDVLDHIGFTVKDFEHSKEFYKRTLMPLGITLMMEITPEQSGGGSHAGFGKAGKAYFWIGTDGEQKGGMHIAFNAPTRSSVREFYKHAIAGGAKDNGAPGLRPHYHDDYYGAFVIDPNGNNLEAVCHQPEKDLG
jgi:catechol 2,3-dioxygenase-like lactoylglutathione lyase family enzyme